MTEFDLEKAFGLRLATILKQNPVTTIFLWVLPNILKYFGDTASGFNFQGTLHKYYALCNDCEPERNHRCGSIDNDMFKQQYWKRYVWYRWSKAIIMPSYHCNSRAQAEMFHRYTFVVLWGFNNSCFEKNCRSMDLQFSLVLCANKKRKKFYLVNIIHLNWIIWIDRRQ